MTRSLWRSLSRRFPRGPSLWPPSAAGALVLLVAGTFAVQWLVGLRSPANWLENWGSLAGENLCSGQLWRLVTHLFLHPGPLPLLGNLAILQLAGRNLETIVGRRHCLAIFLLGGLAPALFRALGALALGPRPAAEPFVGATAGAAAVLLAFTTIMPEMELGALLFLPAPLSRLRARHAAAAVLLAPVAGALFYTVAPLHLADDATGAGRLACVGALLGAAVGWLYAHWLGFGRRWPALFAARVIAADHPGEGRPGTAEGAGRPHPDGAPPRAAQTASAATTAAGTAVTVPQGEARPGGPAVNASPEPGPVSVPVPADAAGPGPRPAAGTELAGEPSFSEREREMTTREFISEVADPVLDKIFREGLDSLNAQERQALWKTREKIVRVVPPRRPGS